MAAVVNRRRMIKWHSEIASHVLQGSGNQERRDGRCLSTGQIKHPVDLLFLYKLATERPGILVIDI